MAARDIIVSPSHIERGILLLRGRRVMLSTDLAAIYDVPPKALIQAMKRNADRFPSDFVFQLTREEYAELKSQSVTLGRSPRATPYAFTEHGAVMLANVLRSPTAVQASIAVVRAFVRLREVLATNADLARKVEALERKYDGQFKVVFDALRALMKEPEAAKKPQIGYHTERGGAGDGASRDGRRRSSAHARRR